MKIYNKLFNTDYEWPPNPDLLDDYRLIDRWFEYLWI